MYYITSILCTALTQIEKISIITKMESWVFGHFIGQFFYPDTSSKVTLKMGQKIYITTNFETVYSIPKKDKNGHLDCYEHHVNESLDDCFIKVSLECNLITLTF